MAISLSSMVFQNPFLPLLRIISYNGRTFQIPIMQLIEKMGNDFRPSLENVIGDFLLNSLNIFTWSYSILLFKCRREMR